MTNYSLPMAVSTVNPVSNENATITNVGKDSDNSVSQTGDAQQKKTASPKVPEVPSHKFSNPQLANSAGVVSQVPSNPASIFPSQFQGSFSVGSQFNKVVAVDWAGMGGSSHVLM